MVYKLVPVKPLLLLIYAIQTLKSYEFKIGP